VRRTCVRLPDGIPRCQACFPRRERQCVIIDDGSAFPTAAHLASYAGIAPATKSSGSSIRGEHAPRTGNRKLKRAMRTPFSSSCARIAARPWTG
jgi:transposase